MKKFTGLFLATCAAAGSLLICSHIIMSSIQEVPVQKARCAVLEDCIVCPGRIEYDNITSVCHDSSAIVKEIKVKPGDKVRKGQKIMSVNNILNPVPKDPTEIYSDSLPDISKSSAHVPEMYKGILNKEISGPSVRVNSNISASDKITEISAPVSGTIVSVNTAPGETITRPIPVISISPDTKMQVRTSISESRISQIKEGLPARITGSAFREEECSGKIKSISNEARQSVSTAGPETVVDILLSLDNPGANIKPGFTAKCKIITDSGNTSIVIPIESICCRDSSEPYVYVYSKGFAEKRIVRTGKETENEVEVISGISEGDPVITTPEKISKNGIRVNAVLE